MGVKLAKPQQEYQKEPVNVYPIIENDILFDKSSLYMVEGALGKGFSGHVARCKQFQLAKKKVAVKILNFNFPWSGRNELATLKELSKLDPDKNNLVRFNRHFTDNAHACLEFELLDKSLYDFMKLRHFKPLCLSEIRVITQQLLVALNALKSIGLAHKGIQPQKVMLVNQLESFRVKLSGFRAAGPVSTFWHGTTEQWFGYRAPEDLLGLPMNAAIDMWGLGCILAFLYLGQHLYSLGSEYEVMRAIVQMQGLPDDDMLKNGRRTRVFFTREKSSWRLNDQKKYYLKTGYRVHRSTGIFNKLSSLDDMAKTHPKVKNNVEYKDTLAFLSLIKQMLQVNPRKRISPSEALRHRFVTMKHLKCKNKDPYVTNACLAMEECGLKQSSVECKSLETSSKVIGWNGLSIAKLDDSLSADHRIEENEPPATADIVTAGNENNGLPDKLASAAFNDPNSAGTDEKAPDTNKSVSLVSVRYYIDGNSNEGSTRIDKIKWWKKWLLNDYPIVENYILFDKSSLYMVEGTLGKGFSGHVAQCKQFQLAKKKVAVKILNFNFPWCDRNELAMLKELSKLDPDKNNLVRFNRHFKLYGYVCLEFELLDKSLYDFMKLRHFKPLCLSEIRVITQQLLVALNALKSIGLAHKGIRPQKVMLVNQLESFRVKLSGFRAAGPVSKSWHGTTYQWFGYRAPEDLLGLPMNEAIDMWGLGCILVFLYLGQHLYSLGSEYEVMRAIVQMQGLPDDDMLKNGRRTRVFFTREKSSWRLNDQKKYYLKTGYRVHRSTGIFNKLSSLDDMAKTHSKVKNDAEYKDTLAFLSLIKQMLQVNPRKRISPSEALRHRFVTMKHFCNNKDPYVTTACLAMEECGLKQSSVECKSLETSSKVIGWNGLSSIAKVDDPLSADHRIEENEPPATADIVTAGNENNGLPDKLASAAFNDPNSAGTDEKAPDTNKAASPASVSHNSHEGNSNSNEGSTHVAEVKCRKKWLKRIKRFFSRKTKP